MRDKTVTRICVACNGQWLLPKSAANEKMVRTNRMESFAAGIGTSKQQHRKTSLVDAKKSRNDRVVQNHTCPHCGAYGAYRDIQGVVNVQPQVAPPANWYPDPHDATKLRYWDGYQWTEATT